MPVSMLPLPSVMTLNEMWWSSLTWSSQPAVHVVMTHRTRGHDSSDRTPSVVTVSEKIGRPCAHRVPGHNRHGRCWNLQPGFNLPRAQRKGKESWIVHAEEMQHALSNI